MWVDWWQKVSGQCGQNNHTPSQYVVVPDPLFEMAGRWSRKEDQQGYNRTMMSSTQVLHDYYEILEIPWEADIDSIKTSYKRLARIRHPDKNSSSTATSEFQLARISPHTYGSASANNTISSRKHIQLSWTPKAVKPTTLSIHSPSSTTQHLRQTRPRTQPALPNTREHTKSQHWRYKSESLRIVCKSKKLTCVWQGYVWRSYAVR